MNTKLHSLAIALALVLVLMLAGCVGFGDPLDSEDLEKIDEQIRESIEKTFPLPDQVVIKTHIGDDLHFSTELKVDEVVAFYRDAYAQKGYVEESGSQVSEDSATLIFLKDSEKDVSLDIAENEEGSDVHIWIDV